MTLIAIEWDDAAGRDGRGAVRLLDQTLLPGTTAVPRSSTPPTTSSPRSPSWPCAARPPSGSPARWGSSLAMDEGAREGWGDAQVQAAVDRVRHARPTAVNLAWGVDQVRPLMDRGRDAVLAAARRVATRGRGGQP